jgi:hypothetical protein
MSTAMISINTGELERDGFVALKRLVSAEDLAEFEALIERFSEAQVAKLGLSRHAAESFIDVFNRGGRYTDRIYKLLERLAVLNRMSARVGEELARCGFLDWAKIDVPLVWPDIRADIPGDPKRTLTVHQDYKSMLCRRAWRLWIPLRPANATLGSMAIYPGTHKLGVVDHQFVDPSKPIVDPAIHAGIEPVVMNLPAGDGILMNPMCLHASVPNISDRTKFTLMVQVQDYASVFDPNDSQDEFAAFERFSAERSKADAAANP